MSGGHEIPSYSQCGGHPSRGTSCRAIHGPPATRMRLASGIHASRRASYPAHARCVLHRAPPAASAPCRRHPWRLFLPIRAAVAPELVPRSPSRDPPPRLTPGIGGPRATPDAGQPDHEFVFAPCLCGVGSSAPSRHSASGLSPSVELSRSAALWPRGDMDVGSGDMAVSLHGCRRNEGCGKDPPEARPRNANPGGAVARGVP
jgi:hypothetical protein